MIDLELINIKKIFDENTLTYTFSPTKNNKSEYQIIFKSINEKVIHFKLNCKLIENITISNNNKTSTFKIIPLDGLLVSGLVSENNPLIISIKILDLCTRVTIKNFKQYNNKNFINLTWDKIYIINLLRRSDRKEEMIKKLEKENITNYEFVEAFDGKSQEVIDKHEKIKSTTGTKILSSGHFGCLLSHIKVIEMAKENKYERIIILEDDVNFEKNFNSIIKSIKLPKFDILYLGGITNRIKLFFEDWGYPEHVMGAYAYMLTKKMYEPILNELYKYEQYVDILYLQKIQKEYKVIILNDVIKTNLDTSDTSAKSNVMVQRLNAINIVQKFI